MLKLSLLIFTLGLLFCSTQGYALTVFGNWRSAQFDHRYYNVNGYSPRWEGYQDTDGYPYTYELPWNRCFNYCTCYPRPCWERCNTNNCRRGG